MPSSKSVPNRPPRLPSPIGSSSDCQWTSPRGLRATYVECVRRDLPFHGFVATYAVLAFLIGAAVEQPGKFAPFNYLGFVTALPRVLLLLVTGTGLWSLKSATPLRSFRGALAAGFSPHTDAGLVLLANLSVFLGAHE